VKGCKLKKGVNKNNIPLRPKKKKKMQIEEPKGITPKIREHKLRSSVN
jgi:hypothetical protein